MPIKAMMPTELMAIKVVISFSVRTRSCSTSYPFISPIYP